MLRAFIEVLQELWDFVLDKLKIKLITKTTKSSVPNQQITQTVTPAASGVEVREEMDHEVYVLGDKLDCFTSEDFKTFKNKVMTFMYGESLRCLRTSEDMSLVAKGDTRCWVKTTGITFEPNSVFPSFVPLAIYDVHNEQTIRLRKLLKPHFEKRATSYLEPEEFILYRLMKDKVAIPWNLVNSLPEKSWYQRMLNHREVIVSTEPHTRSVLEYTDEEGVFKQGYVVAVSPDHTITLESIGRRHRGEFRLEQLFKAQWEQWNAMFINFV